MKLVIGWQHLGDSCHAQAVFKYSFTGNIMKKIAIAMCAVMVCLTGCGSQVITLTEDESNQIVTYAADVLLKYNGAAAHGINSTTLADEEQTDTAADTSQDTTNTSEESDSTSDTSGQTYTQDSSAVSLSEVLNLEGCTVEYVSLTSADSLTEGDYFDMLPQSGDVYQVLTVRIVNNTGSDVSLDFSSQSPQFTYEINGQTYKAARTVLSDDLANMQTTIKSGDSQKAVLVTEVSEGSILEPESIFLYCLVNDIKGYVTLL